MGGAAGFNIWTNRPHVQCALVAAVGITGTGLLLAYTLWAVGFMDGSFWLRLLPLATAAITLLLLIRMNRRRSPVVREWIVVADRSPERRTPLQRSWQILSIYGVVVSIVLLIVSAGVAMHAADTGTQRIEVEYTATITPTEETPFALILPIPHTDSEFRAQGDAELERVEDDQGAGLRVVGQGVVVVTTETTVDLREWSYETPLSREAAGDARSSTHHVHLDADGPITLELILGVRDCSGTEKLRLASEVMPGRGLYEAHVVQHAEGECIRPWDMLLIPFMMIGAPIMTSAPLYVLVVVGCAVGQSIEDRRQGRGSPA